MSKTEAIAYFEELSKNAQWFIDNTDPKHFTEPSYTFEMYKAAHQKQIDACKIALKHLKK